MSTPSDNVFFRREYARLVASLTRRMGIHKLEQSEDAAQAALMAALESWPKSGVPDNPSAWLSRTARNYLVGELRTQSRRERIVARDIAWNQMSLVAAPPEAALANEIRDDAVRMLFACCDDAIPAEAQLILALKTLCGFEVREIADRLLTSEASVYKRLSRARDSLCALPFELSDLTASQLASRLPTVHAIVYTLFTEGYLSSQTDNAIRRELCHEAIHLAQLLADHPVTATSETFALLALFHLHTARISARQDGAGGLLLLEEQDRSLWDQQQVGLGLRWLARSAHGNVFSRYHAEAGIAVEHCLAPSFAETRWDRIVDCYATLERLAPSAIHALNRAVASAELSGPAAGLAVLRGLQPPSWLAGSYMWAAVLADLHRRCGDFAAAKQYRDAALKSAPSTLVGDALRRRLDRGG